MRTICMNNIEDMNIREKWLTSRPILRSPYEHQFNEVLHEADRWNAFANASLDQDFNIWKSQHMELFQSDIYSDEKCQRMFFTSFYFQEYPLGLQTSSSVWME